MAEGMSQIDAAEAAEQAKRQSEMDLASRRAEEASLRRYDAAGWLRKMVGKDLPDQPSEEDFRLGLRSGIVLCNALNKIQPGAIPKVVEAPSDYVIVPDGAALSAFQYFENIRNFLDSIDAMGIPGFEASDLEQGGKSSRIVNCVMALKSYSEWKEGGGKGVWKFSGTAKPHSANKYFLRKNSDLFVNSLSRSSSNAEKSLDSYGDLGQDLHEMGMSEALHVYVRELLSDKKQEDIPLIVGSMLSKVMEEFEQRLARQNEQAGTSSRYADVPSFNEHQAVGTSSRDIDVPSYSESLETSNIMEDKRWSENDFHDGKSKQHGSKRQGLLQHHQRSVQELRSTLHSTKEDLHILHMKYQEEIQYLGKHLNGLASAASRYQKVLEENRKLYNQVQDLKGNIRVYCRIRPFLPGQTTGVSTSEALDDQTLSIITPAKGGKGKKLFTFNKVFGPSASQEAVFSDTRQLIRSVLDGYNVCIFAYGQTGSGKTYTMTGPKELTPESSGVNYRALSDLFFISEQRKDSMSYDVSVQMIEIYNEQVRDLLVTDNVDKKLEICNNSQNGINVPDANIVPVTSIPVTSTSDVINLMNIGLKNRAVGSTSMNDRSSRSHSCVTVHVRGRNLTSGSIICGSMHLVDLAGSERADKTDADGDRLKEAQHINRSLTALGDVIASLAQKQSHVPYRNSKLTQLLQESLGGQAKTLMFIHISPEAETLGETMSTLKFAERVSTVEQGASRSNKDTPDVRELKEQIASLKTALLRKERGESGFQQPRSLSPDRTTNGSFTTNPSPAPSWQSRAEGQPDFSPVSRMQSYDDIHFMDSPLSVVSTEEEKSVSGDWVDKVMVKNQGGLSGEDGSESPDVSYQKNRRDNSKVYPEQSLSKIAGLRQKSLENGVVRNQNETAATDESDDLEIENSDCSEIDYECHVNVPKLSSTPNGGGKKSRKPTQSQKQQQQQIKSPDTRSLIPQPSTRKASNGPRSPMQKQGKKPATGDVKRKPASTSGK